MRQDEIQRFLSMLDKMTDPIIRSTFDDPLLVDQTDQLRVAIADARKTALLAYREEPLNDLE